MADIADSRNGGYEGFYPFPVASVTNSSPWEWTGANVGAPATCNTDGAKSRLYIDTIIAYYAPRACQALGLACGFVDVKEISQLEVGLEVAPVPAVGAVNMTAEQPIRAINLFDLNGRLVQQFTAINANQFSMPRNGIQSGLYIAQVRFDQGFVKRKIVFTN